MGTLMARLRQRERVLMSREERVAAVYNFSRLLSRSTSLDETLQNCVDFIGRFFSARVSVNLREKNGQLALKPAASTRRMAPKEASVAYWVFEHKKPAGRYTDTLPLAAGTYYPLVSTGGIVGVLGLRLSGRRRLTPDQEEILLAFVNHAAITIERDFLASERRRARVAEESEKLHAAILNSLSHELRTPIAVIRGAISAIQLKSAGGNISAQAELLHEVDVAATKLNTLVSNLLDMSRIESGKVALNRSDYDLREIVHDALEKTKPELSGYVVSVAINGSGFTCFCDYALLQQVVINLVLNAACHNRPGTRIEIEIRHLEDSDFVIVVRDNGAGIPPELLDSVFEKFVRASNARPGGSGLGLPIARSIAELHGGKLVAANLPTGGAEFVLTLPAPVGNPPL